MLIEIFKDDFGNITGFRHGWQKGCIPPIPENVFEVPEQERDELFIYLTGNLCCVTRGKQKTHKQYGNLRLHQLDTEDLAIRNENRKIFNI